MLYFDIEHTKEKIFDDAIDSDYLHADSYIEFEPENQKETILDVEDDDARKYFSDVYQFLVDENYLIKDDPENIQLIYNVYEQYLEDYILEIEDKVEMKKQELFNEHQKDIDAKKRGYRSEV